ncbi:hypothetical protein [Nitrosococcus wardiae]|nr:hypothetical protein [Nitrosococcus wardiae]
MREPPLILALHTDSPITGEEGVAHYLWSNNHDEVNPLWHVSH